MSKNSIETPFIFGKIASGADFTDREDETRHLVMNFNSGINTILISPRRWGKSSLVQKAASQANRKNKNVRFIFIDLFTVRNEEDFYRTLAEETLRASSSKWEEQLKNIRKFFRQYIPKISLSPDPTTDISIALDWKEVSKQPEEILELPERIAKSHGWKIVLCLDEFQNIGTFKDPVGFQKTLRSHWQKHRHVSYCLYGSKRHMMMELFTSQEMPFYKFGDIMFLEKIKEADWVDFIEKRFTATGKKIQTATAAMIVRHADAHPYYVQQLAQQVWLRTSKTADEKLVEETVDSVLRQLGLLFQTITEGLSSTQLNFLKALLEGVEQLSSKEALIAYQLGTSGNVNRIKEALVSKEVIDVLSERPEFLDPMYKLWLARYYFKISG